MISQALTREQIVSRIEDIIRREANLKEDDDSIYLGEIYADYRDKLENESIKEIFGSNNPEEKFEEKMTDWYLDCEDDYRDNVIYTVRKHFDAEDNNIFYDDYEDTICGWINEHVHFRYPYNHYLEQEVCIDIIVDTGDGNYDFNCNELFGCTYSEKGVKEKSSLIWLMKQQGYTDMQVMDFIDNDNLYDSRLLNSIYEECINTSTCMNALTFFVKMTLRESFDMQKEIEDKGKSEKIIILSKNTPCGLYDPWNGAGSVLEIKLEKDVELPVKYIDSAMPDGNRGYSVRDIYGICSSFWVRNR